MKDDEDFKRKNKKLNKIITHKNKTQINTKKISKKLIKKKINTISDNESKNIFEEKKFPNKLINILEDEENNNNNENNNNLEKKKEKGKEEVNILESKGNHSDKETNSTDKHIINTGNQNNEQPKKESKLLGKKRHLVGYKQHSLAYNELYKLYNKEEIELNINTLYTYTNLNPIKIKGHFIGILDNNEDNNNPDFIIEIKHQNNNNYNHFIIYNSKNFKKKLSFIENSGGNLYLLYKGYAAFFYNESIKIYFFSNNNTNYDIFQKIMLPEELYNTILFPFKFIHNDNFYFFYKIFSLNKDNKLLLYKFNKEEQKNENDFAIRGKPFVEDKTLNLDFEFIWFAQKNNNELLFFYELNYIFKIYCFDLSTMKITIRKTFSLNNIAHAKIAQYADEVINKRFLALSNHNLLYIIDTHTFDITTVKEHDIIEYFKIFNDNTLWTVESCEKTIIVDNNKRKIVSYMYVRQYKINEKLHEFIKIGERKLKKNYSIINNITQIGNKKVLLFVEGKKIIMLN